MRRWKLICVLLVAACGLIPASRLVGQQSPATVPETETAIFGNGLLPHGEKDATFAGLARSETIYGQTLGVTNVGTTEYPPGIFARDEAVNLNVSGAFSAIAMNETDYGVRSRYAFAVANDPAVLEDASRLVPFDFWRVEGPQVQSPRPSESGRRYGTAVRQPSEPIGFLGDQSNPVVDAVYLQPSAGLSQQPVLESFDFSDPSIPSRGGFISSVFDPARDVAYFGTAPSGAELAVLSVGGPTRSMLGVVPIDLNSNAIFSMDIDRANDRVYVLVDSPFRIVSLTRATSDTLPVVIDSMFVDVTVEERPEVLSVDGENGQVFLYSRFPGSRICTLRKYVINPDGSLSLVGTLSVNETGNRLMLHDKENRWIYLFTHDLVGATFVRRIDGRRGADPQRIWDSGKDTYRIQSTRFYNDGGFLTDDRSFSYLFGGNVEGAANSVLRLRVDGSRDLAGAVIGQLHQYQPPSQYRNLPGVIQNMNIYTHGDGGKIRLGLYRSTSSSIEAGVLIWQSEELDSTPGGWLSVPVRDANGNRLEVLNGQRLILSFQVPDEKAQPGHVSRSNGNTGFRLSHQYGKFPVLNNPVPLPRTDAYAMNLDILYSPNIGDLRVSGQTSPWTLPVWIGSSYIVFSTDGAAEWLDISYTADFSEYETIPFRNSFPFSIREDLFLEGETVRLYFRARIGDLLPSFFSGVLRVDTLLPEKPDPPLALGNSPSNDRRARFELPPFPADAGGSGVQSYQVLLSSTPDGVDELQSSNNIQPGLFESISMPLSTSVYARIRAVDRAGNTGPWSESSEMVYINAPPVISINGLLPGEPGTLDDITPSYTITDSDGDEITAISPEWRRIVPFSQPITTNSLVLSHTLTTKGETWRFSISGTDSRGSQGASVTSSVTIQNSLPTQPIVKLVPATPDPDEDLVCDVRVYSSDADGDRIGYDFRWFKSEDGGATFIEKLELGGSPQVSRNFINEGEIWEVSYQPYELGSTRGVNRVEGPDGRDRVYIGRNGLPEFTVGQPFGPIVGEELESHTIDLNVFWNFNEPDGETCTVDLYWTDLAESGLVPIAEGLDAELRRFRGTVEIPNNRPIHIHAIITDEKGAIVQRITPPILIGEVGTGVLTY